MSIVITQELHIAHESSELPSEINLLGKLTNIVHGGFIANPVANEPLHITAPELMVPVNYLWSEFCDWFPVDFHDDPIGGQVWVHQAEGSSDLYFDLELSISNAYSSSLLEVMVPNEKNPELSTTYLKARSYNDLEWSSIIEADFTTSADYEGLKLTEMMYSPLPPTEEELARGWSRDDFAWIEIQNTGENLLPLKNSQFIDGISYTFPEFYLKPGERVVLVKNLEAFSSRYDTNTLSILSGYTGNLARKGETLTLQSPKGETILSFTYSNTWYPETDQKGYSLVVVNSNAASSAWSSPENWKPSSTLGGNPGRAPGSTHPVISNASVAESGVLCFNVSGAETFFIEVSTNMKSWSLFELWEVRDGLILIDTKSLGEEVLFFRVRL